MGKLKPCPFCGGKADLVRSTTKENNKGFMCSDCGAGYMPPFRGFNTFKEAVEAWNARINDAYDQGYKDAVYFHNSYADEGPVYSLVDGVEYDELLEIWRISLSCGHIVYQTTNTKPRYCSVCGNEVM